MQMLAKICRNQNQAYSSVTETLTEGTKLRPVKAVRRDGRFLSLAQIDKLYHELK